MRRDGSVQRAADGHDLLVQPLGPAPVQRQPAEQDDAGDGVGRLGEAGPRQVVVDEALGAEPGEQTLGHALPEMQVHGVVAEHAGVFEDDAADGGVAAPVGELLVCPAWARAGVSRMAVQVGSAAARRSSGGKVQTVLPSRSAPGRRGSAPIRSSEHDSASRKGAASNRTHRRDRSRRSRQRSTCPCNASCRSRAASSSSSAMRRRSASTSAASSSRASRSASAVADAARAEAAFDVVVDHLRQAAQLGLDGLGLADEHLQHAVLGALGQDEVVAAHLGRRLQLAVDAAVALLDAAGVPGQVEVEQVGAVGLEVQPLAGGVGCEQDA